MFQVLHSLDAMTERTDEGASDVATLDHFVKDGVITHQDTGLSLSL